MDWDLAIGRNRRALLRLLAVLLAGLAGVGVLPASIYRRMLRVLGPAESAMRRLVIVAARDMVVAAPVSRAFPAGIARGNAPRAAVFALFDPMKRFKARAVGSTDPNDSEDPLVDCAALARRATALAAALDDVTGQARRLARWQARRRGAMAKGQTPRRTSPRRPGFPPGTRLRGRLAVDRILADCDGLARRILDRPDCPCRS